MIDTAYPHVADRLFGRAHAIEPNAFRALIESPAGRRIIAGERTETSAKDLRALKRERLGALIEGEWIKVPGGLAEYFVTSTGVAILPVMGILSQRFDWLAALCGWTTYEGLSACIDATEQDYRVAARLMDVDSPGGECGGMLDAADKIIAARGGKPIWAVANTCAASAAYALAGSAARLIVPRLAQVGSIGAVSIHLDRSAADQAQGLKYTAVFSGARKIDGWEHAPLSRDARVSAQGRADYCRALFADLVGRQGRMNPAAALATEAEMFFDEQAVELKLADAVGTFEDAVNELADVSANRSTANRGASAMTKVAAVDPQPAASTPPAPAAPAPTAPAAPAPVAAAPAPAAPPAATAAKDTKAEKCPDCGREYMPGDDDEAARANRYTLATAVETLELCILASASLADAKAFVAAKTPVAKVRTDLAAKAAAASDALETDPARRNAPTATAGWDEVTEKVNKQFGIAPKK